MSRINWKFLSCAVCATAMLFSIGGSVLLADSILASDDTWVREDNSDSNRNGNDQMNARTQITDDNNDAILLRFDVSSLSGPAPGVSTLQLFWQRTTTDSMGKILKVYGVNETDPDETTWLDDTVTYDDAPGMIPDGGGDPLVNNAMTEFDDGHTEADIYDLDEANTTFIGEVVTDAAVTAVAQNFSSTALTDFINADTNGEITLLLFRDQTTSGHQLRFIPSEIAIANGVPQFSPTLLIAPEPASLVMVFLGGLAFVAVRRRR